MVRWEMLTKLSPGDSHINKKKCTHGSYRAHNIAIMLGSVECCLQASNNWGGGGGRGNVGHDTSFKEVLIITIM